MLGCGIKKLDYKRMHKSKVARIWAIKWVVRLSFLTLPFGLSQEAKVSASAPVKNGRQAEIERVFLEIPEGNRFRNHLEELTKEPHVAGTQENRRVGEYIAGVMRKAGMQVTVFEYDVYLPEGPGRIQVEILTPQREVLNTRERVVKDDPYSKDPRLHPGWNAFSGSGDVSGEVVYVNMGRKEDFEALAQQGTSLKGKIALARYGGNFRGYKAKYAQKAGAIGLIIFNDPGAGYREEDAYPQGYHMNETTVQRGSLLTLDYTGDPLTPFQPALPLDGPVKIDRLSPKSVAFHTIPVTPIPFGSAIKILSQMKGNEAPAEWQGSLKVKYRIEGGSNLKLRLMVDQPYKMVRIANVVGTFAGVRFPHEWILLGSHYDAWGHGAVDPNGGTAMLLTLAENLGTLIGKGFRPARTIKIAHFDAEEFGIIGSSEWVEQFRADLTRKAVAYINADGAVSGGVISASSSPTLKSLIMEASKAVSYPGTGRTVYEQWRSQNPENSHPKLGNLGGGSDHVGFYTFLGIPSAGISFSGKAPIYHSAYDNFAWYSRFGDKDFVFGPCLAQLDGILALRLANEDVLPYDLSRYARDLNNHISELETRAKQLGTELRLERLRRTTKTLGAVANQLQARLAEIDVWDSRKLQAVNQRLLTLERQWLNGDGIPFSNWNRSLYASPDPFSGYASWMLPGIRYQIETSAWDQVPQAEADVLEVVKELLNRMSQILRVLVGEK